MERRARARVLEAALRNGRIASQRRQLQMERNEVHRVFAKKGMLSSFSCVTTFAHDGSLRAMRDRSTAVAREAMSSHARAVQELQPWARLRIGLERRLARRQSSAS